jgi:hypothetical protein
MRAIGIAVAETVLRGDPEGLLKSDARPDAMDG